jgi:site-specific DNA-methyltransferase (adenine-specific)
MNDYRLKVGDCQTVLPSFGEDFFHACITDPPYGMGMDHWDHSVPSINIWREVYRTLRPGAFCLAFCSPELYHRLACNIEDAGFTIKDQIMWMTTTKMPKYNRLKPAHEPIVVAQKPPQGTLRDNQERWGCGLIDTETTRVPWDKKPPTGWVAQGAKRRTFGKDGKTTGTQEEFGTVDANPNGRYPSNIIGEVESAHQKYFYAPRATRKEKGDFNNHPTVKPIDLMAYLIKIYSAVNSTVLDPFCGSGSTGVAAIQESRKFVGIDLSQDYIKISKMRIAAAIDQKTKSPNRLTFEDDDPIITA